jgi:folate-binding protein YgfZ
MTAQLPFINRAFFDLSLRVKLRVTGSDRVRFLNGQITNDIRKATETSAVEACVLNAKGKMEAHLFVHAQSDSFFIDADPALKPLLQTRLERYIIADDVEIEDVTTQWSIFHVIGRAAPKLAGEFAIISADRFGISGHDIWCAPFQRDQIARELAKEFAHCDEACAEQLRIEQGIPRWGRELTGEIIPVEANLEQRCIDYEKGCYIGQETISRMKMSGQRNKQLCGLVSLSGSPFTPGKRLLAGKVGAIDPNRPEDKDVGWITSVTRSGRREIALGYVKRGFNSAGTKLDAVARSTSRISVQVVDLPFAAQAMADNSTA